MAIANDTIWPIDQGASASSFTSLSFHTAAAGAALGAAYVYFVDEANGVTPTLITTVNLQ